MKHFLITRFNLKNKQTLKDNLILNPLSNDWLENRFELFEKYCLPSVINQSKQNFIWCLCFDIDTPIEYKNKIDSILKNYKNYNAIYIDGFQNLKIGVKNFISTQITNNDKFIITSRLDNDDILNKDFISTIQKKFITQHNTIIDLNNGYKFYLKDNPQKSELLIFNSKLNPFVSIIEHSSNFKTILDKPHNKWDNTYKKVNYSEKALWIQVIHEQNAFNRKLNYLNKAFSLNNYEDFSLNIPLNLESKNKIILDNLYSILPKLYYRLKLFIKNIKKIISS
ncbi:glycosyltransferase [Pontimicrobium sp. IMCC45349]|uniref:glycosyltransferase n=1 Tax=Pontimicrobium sp. IMCC45349 TaxID=3391574 RepID=UPI0039A3E403